MEPDPEVFLEAEKRVAELLQELERVKQASAHVEEAQESMQTARSEIKSLTSKTTELAQRLTELADQLHRLNPGHIMTYLHDLSTAAEAVEVQQRKHATLMKIVLSLTSVLTVLVLVLLWKQFQ